MTTEYERRENWGKDVEVLEKLISEERILYWEVFCEVVNIDHKDSFTVSNVLSFHLAFSVMGDAYSKGKQGWKWRTVGYKLELKEEKKGKIDTPYLVITGPPELKPKRKKPPKPNPNQPKLF